MTSAADHGVGRLVVDARVEREGFALDVSLEAEPGSVVGLTGDIGSGKSTALWLIAGRLRAESGTVHCGETVWDDPAAGVFAATRPVSLLTQEFRADLAEERTGVENVADTGATQASARQLLADFGVESHVVDRLPWTFSGAEAQRVALARALVPRQPVVLIDEPFGTLDKRTGGVVRDHFEGWLAEFDGVTVLATTRDADLDRFATHVISL